MKIIHAPEYKRTTNILEVSFKLLKVEEGIYI